jgi:hypothetical protein
MASALHGGNGREITEQGQAIAVVAVWVIGAHRLERFKQDRSLIRA